ncbi:uncharacterized protein ARMOST_08517 [Armillaria ostoyae]|uniref:Heterokaryon incompatibility domain-containing protein n=1 Tax=Armillaria ostoyae TaxID=47428 RepID=A0A284R8V6_ARMOS|nr:uncharacterized protein ARMOST_08517 [Armillaria ostoyae]
MVLPPGHPSPVIPPMPVIPLMPIVPRMSTPPPPPMSAPLREYLEFEYSSSSSSSEETESNADGAGVFESDTHSGSPEVTISALTETGQAESSIKVPLQRSYTGTKPVILSSLADTPCATLGIPGLLDQFNATLGTCHTLDTPSLPSLLDDCIKNNYDFGTAYARLRAVWSADNHRNSTILDELRRREAGDRKMRQEVLVGNRIVRSTLPPRRVWDLCANRVVSWWSSSAFLDWSQTRGSDTTRRSNVRPISHAWMHEKDRVDVQTPINGYEWPVPIPTDANLDLIRIEMLNLELEYTWLDVLCLRQKGGTKEELRDEEWKLDVPTIGSVYQLNKVVIYLSGLGRPLTLKEGDLESDQCWFRRAWTVQEPIDKDNTGILAEFHKQLRAIDSIHHLTRRLSLSPAMFEVLSEMQKRVSTNPVDRIAGLALPLLSKMIPVYHETGLLEDAWTALVNEMFVGNRGELFFWYPEPGDAGKKWRPSWDQVMNKSLPANEISDMPVRHDSETHDDWYEGPCVDKGFVRGLAARGTEQVARRGKFIVQDSDGREYAFGIIARHRYPIPEDTYTLLGMDPAKLVRHPVQLRLLGDRNPRPRTQYWVIGRRLSDGKFEKVSVFEMADEKDVRRLSALGITETRRNILI